MQSSAVQSFRPVDGTRGYSVIVPLYLQQQTVLGGVDKVKFFSLIDFKF